MFALSVTIYEKFAIKTCMTMALTLEWINVIYKDANGKALCNFPFVGNSNVCSICDHLRYINSQNVHDLDPDFWNGPRSNVNMPIERPHANFCVGYSNGCPTCHRLRHNHVWTSQCTPFEPLTFKIKVKNVDDLDENW